MSTSFDIPLLQRKTLAPLQWCAILIGLSVPVSVAMDNVLLALVLLGALFSLGSIARVSLSHPVARAALLLLAMLVVAMFYGATPLKAAFDTLGKYIDLLFVPIFIFLFSDGAVRRKARYAFLAAMAVTLVMSWLVGLGILPVMHDWMSIFASRDNPVVFHSHITQNGMMAFAVFLALLEWRDADSLGGRLLWGAFALFGTVNVLFLVQGRTGYLILLVLLGWFVWASLSRHMRSLGRTWGWRQGALIVLALPLIAFAAYHGSDRLHDRVTQVVAEYEAWTPDHGRLTSTGQRLDFYSNTLRIVQDNALLGVGTGGFPAAFSKQIEGKEVKETQNPHNEFLMIAAQTGLVGLAIMLYLFYTLWRCAPHLPGRYEQDAARGFVLAYMVNGLLNSALHDHADGLFFAFMVAALYAGLNRESRHG
ncbi:MAG: O-antigen ligase family protein [Nitrosomonadales bacterium]|nr:O-antigen ligase family protein [Nitrosomonadales bacterium]